MVNEEAIFLDKIGVKLANSIILSSHTNRVESGNCIVFQFVKAPSQCPFLI